MSLEISLALKFILMRKITFSMPEKKSLVLGENVYLHFHLVQVRVKMPDINIGMGNAK